MESARQDDNLHKKVLVGLLVGALLGLFGNWLGARDEGARSVVRFLADGVAHPVGQVFLRLLFLVVVLCFATSRLLLVKTLTVGMAVAVFLDATLVRALLVPATMHLLGRYNWWAPAWWTRRRRRTDR